MEAEFLLFLQNFVRNDILDPFMIFITHTGDYGILCIILAVVMIIVPKTRRLGHVTAISLAIEFIINNGIIKNAVARTRPYDVIEELEILIGKQPDYSFPSGHSGITFAFAGAIIFALVKGMPGLDDMKKNNVISLLLLLYSLLLAFSRMYVGVHYPTDVLAGMLLGLLTGFVSYYIEKPINSAWLKRGSKTKPITD